VGVLSTDRAVCVGGVLFHGSDLLAAGEIQPTAEDDDDEDNWDDPCAGC